jgi:type II secretory pathway pseudopilin PulG
MKRTRGFTLAELVIAFGIVAVAILSLVGVFVAGLKLSSRSRELAVAVEIGHQVMESIKQNTRTVGFGYVPAGAYTFDGRATTPTPQVGAAPSLFPPAPYPRSLVNAHEYRVVVSGQALSATLKQVRTEVFYGTSGRVSFVTLLRP